MKTKRGKETAGKKFVASRGWLLRFKKRSHLHNIKVQGEAASADGGTSKLSKRTKIMNEGGYIKQQVCNVEAALY